MQCAPGNVPQTEWMMVKFEPVTSGPQTVSWPDTSADDWGKLSLIS